MNMIDIKYPELLKNIQINIIISQIQFNSIDIIVKCYIYVADFVIIPIQCYYVKWYNLINVK